MTIKDVLENKMPVSVAMRKNGYKKWTASRPSNLTRSDAWKQALAQYLPDDKLLKKHEQALEATKWNDFTGEREVDHNTRLKAVVEGYKLKGVYNDNQRISNTQVNISWDSQGYSSSINKPKTLKPK